MTNKQYLTDANNNVFWAYTAVDAVAGLNYAVFTESDGSAQYQRLGNVVTVAFHNVTNGYVVPKDWQPATKQVINDNLTINSDGTLTVASQPASPTNTNSNSQAPASAVSNSQAPASAAMLTTTPLINGVFNYFIK